MNVTRYSPESHKIMQAQILRQFGYTQQQIADCLGKPRETIRDWLKQSANGISNNPAKIYPNGGKDMNGLAASITLYFEQVNGNSTEARRRLRELLSSRDKGTFLKPGKATVKEYLERWLRDYASSNLSPRGLDRYTGIVGKYFIPQFGGITLTTLRPEHLQKHYSDCLKQGLNTGTVRYHRVALIRHWKQP